MEKKGFAPEKNEAMACPSPNCNAAVKSRTLTECSGQNVTPMGISGPLVAKIPVVIAEKIVQIDTEADIMLEEPAFEIKRIKKDLFLTQCKLIPRAGLIENGIPRTGKLFLSGFVRKNIEYATVKCVGTKTVSGDIRHTTVDVPFECVTVVEYDVPPIINTRGISREIDLLCSSENDSCCCAHNCDELLGKFQCEQFFEDVNHFNEKPFCELEDVRIFEADINKFPCNDHKCGNVPTFQKIVEKMVIYARIKVLQLQQVNICACTRGETRGECCE